MSIFVKENKKYSVLCLLIVVLIILVAYISDKRLHTAKESDENYIKLGIPQGVLLGLVDKLKDNISYASFRNIPYAQPPLGNLRFKDPLPALPWFNIRDAIKPGPSCVQHWNRSISGQEDCLILNVFSPDLDPESLLPVVVFVHGGQFFAGSYRRFDTPLLFLQEGIVAVTINYRLGVFGYLTLDNEEVPGNAALKDKVMALRWVQENIKYFGGNPNDVTVFGQSSGAAAVSLLQVSPMAKGLMHKVIASSAGMLNEWSIQQSPRAMLPLLAKNLSLGLDVDHSDFLKALRNTKAEVLCAAAAGIKMEDVKERAFAPVVEKDIKGVESFLIKTPFEYLKNKEFSDIPSIYGYNSQEFARFYERENVEEYFKVPSIITPQHWRSLPIKEVALNRIKEFYLGAQVFDPSPQNRTMVAGAIHLMGDLIFVVGVHDTVQALAKYSEQPTYLYKFSYDSLKRIQMKASSLGIKGAAHGDNIEYIIRRDINRLQDTSGDSVLTRRMIRLLTNFIKSGNPTPKSDTELSKLIWLPVTKAVNHYIEISDVLTPGVDPDRSRIDFWRALEKFMADEKVPPKKDTENEI